MILMFLYACTPEVEESKPPVESERRMRSNRSMKSRTAAAASIPEYSKPMRSESLPSRKTTASRRPSAST